MPKADWTGRETPPALWRIDGKYQMLPLFPGTLISVNGTTRNIDPDFRGPLEPIIR